MKRYNTYIFDLDGTLTDTLTTWLGIFRDCLEECGITAPDDVTLSKHTHDWKEMLKLGLPETKLHDFITLAHRYAKNRLPKAPLHAGALDALQALKDADRQVGIFSTMDRPIVEVAMKVHGFSNYAQAEVAGTDVPRRKPDPDGILKAMKDLGVAEEHVGTIAYIGDKSTDIQAANAAGIDGILYYPASHQLFYDEAELKAHQPKSVIINWQELIDSLA